MNGEIDNIVIKGRHVLLTPYDEKYREFVYSCHCNMSVRMLWTDEREFYSIEQFMEHFQSELRRFYHVYFIILEKKDRKPIGFVYSYNYNHSDGLIYETIFIVPKFQTKGFGAEAGLLFTDYLWRFYPLRKIYCDVYGYNAKSQKLLKGVGFEVEGTFKEHRFFDGSYYDMFRFSCFRNNFYMHNKRRIKWYSC